MFSVPTYIVLELPPEIASKVSVLRSRYDSNTAKLPAEITIAGSSGIGTLAANQNAEETIRSIQHVAHKHLPFLTAFASIEQFPNTQIFWLKPRDRKPFDALQNAFVAAGIKFFANPFPFNPHCTISAKATLSTRQESELRAISIPTEEFVLSTLCLYQSVQGKASLLKSFTFRSRNNREQTTVFQK